MVRRRESPPSPCLCKNKHLLLCHVLVFRFGFVDFLLSFLVHLLLQLLLLSVYDERETERESCSEDETADNVGFSLALLNPALLLTEVSELFELSTLTLLCYSGQLLNQLQEEGDNKRVKHVRQGALIISLLISSKHIFLSLYLLSCSGFLLLN